MVDPGATNPRAGGRRSRAQTGVLVASVVLIGLLASCSSPSSSGPSTSRAVPRETEPSTTVVPVDSTPGSTGPPLVACATGQLAGSAARGPSPDGAETTVTLTNTSARPCVLAGYPTLQLVDRHGAPLRTRTVDGGSFPFTSLPATVVPLAPGATAVFHIGSSDAPADGRCSAGSALQVTPPANYDHLTVGVALTACAGGTLEVSPVLPAAHATP